MGSTTRTVADLWPHELDETFDQALVCGYASLTRDGRPVTWPVTPYVGAGTLDVTTGLTYPDKAERARVDPRVALLFGPTGSTASAGSAGAAGPAEPGPAPHVLVQGTAAVRDADLQANTDRYLRESMLKTGDGFAGMPWFLMRRLGWYFARIWVEVTPERIVWWPGGDLASPPQVWVPDGPIISPVSDPRPVGPRRPRRAAPPADWRPFAARAERLGCPLVTWAPEEGPGSVGPAGDRWPTTVPTRSITRTENGFEVVLPGGVRAPLGPVCLTFHQHGPGMQWQENVVLIGDAVEAATGTDGAMRLVVRVSRALNDWSLAGRPRQRTRAFLRPGRELRARLESESARRGQPVPQVRR